MEIEEILEKQLIMLHERFKEVKNSEEACALNKEILATIGFIITIQNSECFEKETQNLI